MLGRVRRKAKVKGMGDKRDETLEERADGAAIEEAAEKLDKSDVGAVAGGAGGASTKNYDEPPELPEIP